MAENLVEIKAESSRDWSTNARNEKLQEYRDCGRAAVPNKADIERIQTRMEGVTINQHFYGGSHNIVNASSQIEQSMLIGVSPGDIGNLLVALRELGLSESAASGLEEALSANSNPRQAAIRWLFEFSADILAGALGEVAAANYGAIVSLITAFGSSVIG